MNRILPIIALSAVLVVNFLANYLPIGGKRTGEVSEMHPTLFTPAGFTFSIWGVIYLFLIFYVVYQAFNRNKERHLFDGINKYFLINCLSNTAWIFAWHYEFITLSLVLIVVTLTSLIGIYRHTMSAELQGVKDRLFVKIPFSLYLGWITVATLANLTIEQTVMGMDDWLVTEIVWTFIKLALAGAIGAVMIIRYRDLIFGMVVAWAAFGIVNKQVDTPQIMGAAAAVMILVLVTLIIESIKRVHSYLN